MFYKFKIRAMENLKLLSRLQLNQNTMFYKSYIYIYI